MTLKFKKHSNGWSIKRKKRGHADYQPFIRWYKSERALRIQYHTFYTRDFQELESLKYNKDNETVVATFWYGAVKTANVHMDSGTSMIRDIIKQIR